MPRRVRLSGPGSHRALETPGTLERKPPEPSLGASTCACTSAAPEVASITHDPFSELEELEVAAVPLAGNSLADSNVKKPRHEAEDAALATRLWDESEKIVQSLG